MDVTATGDDLVAAVRSGDYERFLAIQVAPAKKRPALYAIVAFHIEIASIAEIVSEALIGHIRLAWWREALEEIEAGKVPRNHPVVLALADVFRAHPHVFTFLHTMIEARAADMDSSLIAEEADWRAYCNNTAGALHMAMAMVLDEPCTRAKETLIRDAGVAYAMIGLAKSIPFMASQGWMRFPHARLDAHQVTSLAPSEALNRFVLQILRDDAVIRFNSNGKIRAQPNDRKLQSLSALVALMLLSKRQLERVSGDPYRLRPAKLRAVWCVMQIKHCSLTYF